MRKTFLLICFWGMLQTLFAADTLFVREQQVPILIDRIDNVLYEMRIPARKGDVLNEITLRFGDEVDLSTIAAVRLFYSGVEAPSRKDERFSPTAYISNHKPGDTRKALAAYSVLQDEIINPMRTVRLTSRQSLMKGIHYFWISIQMKPQTSLLTRVSSTLTDAHVNQAPIEMVWRGKTEERYVGIGVRHAGDDGAAAFRIPGLVTTPQGTLLGVYDIRYNSSVDFSNPNTTKGRNHITIKASLDGGVTWPESCQLLLDENEGWGYTCLSMIDRETIGIFYESSVAHMTFQAISLRRLISH